MQKDSTIDNYYYHCFHCSYKTSKTSNYKSHLQAKHKNEFTIFLQTALNNTKNSDNLNYDYKESNDSNPTSIMTSKNNTKIFQIVSNDLIKQNDNFILLKKVFNNNDHLNRDDDFLGGFYFHQNKMINSGAFSTAFLGEDSRTGFKTIILRKKLSYEEDINREKYILQKTNGLGNFRHYMKLYMTIIIAILSKVC